MSLRSRSYGWYLLGMLASVNFLNYATRNVVFTMYDDLRANFALSNTELGLLGSVFMLSHALVTVPIGWTADRLDRRRVMAAGILVWSIANLASAAAWGLGSLLVSRALAGVATAACVPVANALLCDRNVFAPESKARTVSVFNLGLFLGGAAGFVFGAMLGFPLGFIVLAIPGFVLAVMVWAMDVPARRAGAVRSSSWAAFWRDAVAILRIRTMRWLLLGACLMAFAAGGLLAWFADFVAQTKGMSIEHATLVFGGCALTGGLSGVVVGGVVGDWLFKRVIYGRMAAITIGFLCTIPFGLLSIFVDGGPVFYVATWFTFFFITWYHGPVAAVVDDLVTDERASTAQATFIFLMHLIGTAPSSYVVGLLADEVGLRYALLAPTVAIALGALAVMAGWRRVASDYAITDRS